VDLEREVVLPSGLNVTDYLLQNRNLFVDHNYDVCSSVAVCRDMVMDSRGWKCYGSFHDDLTNPYVRACIALAKAGTLAMSIGFEALDYGAPTPEERAAYPGVECVVRKARVLEVSYTAMPMNVTCRQIAANIDAAAANAEKSRKALADARISDRVMGDLGIKPKRVIIVR
jgi:phage head maturation protease